MAAQPTFTHAAAPRRLSGDATIIAMLLNEMRHAIIRRLFGVPRVDANVMTGVAIALAAAGAQSRIARLRALRPSRLDTAMGAMVVKETTHGIAGEWSRSAPFFSWLIAFALLATSFGPGLRRSWHAVLVSLRDIRLSWRSLRRVLEGE